MNNKDNILKKIFSTFDDFQEIRNQWKKENKKIIFTNGCFDIIHAGHIEYLSHASDLGDKLIIGVNSDSSVKKIKAPLRPVNNAKTRMLVLASFSFVDAVILFQEETPIKLISDILPDILVKGGDYKKEDVIGADIVNNNNGKVLIIPFVKGYSTSALISKIIDREK